MDDDHETLVLGCLICEPSTFDEIASKVQPADFFDEELQEFYEFLIDLHELGKPINDITLVATEVKRRQLMISSARIAEVFGSVTHVGNVSFYVAEVAEASRVRRLGIVLDKFRRALDSPGANSQQIINTVTNGLNSIEATTSIEIVDAEQADAMFDENERGRSMAMTGILKFDATFGGFTSGELITLGARLGTGKTAFGWQVMVHGAKRGRQGLFVSLEMEPRQLVERHLASATGVSPIRIRTNDLQPEHKQLINEARESFRSLPISMFAPSSATVRQIAAAARLKKSGGGLDFLVVDYVQLVRATSRGKDRRGELEEISRDLKALARDLEIPVLALAQLNRAAEETVPRVSHIAECDTIGRDADQVLLLHRKQDSTDLRVAKHRYVADDAAIKLRYEDGRFEESEESEESTYIPRMHCS